MNFVDPTIAVPAREHIEYAPRPTRLQQLRIGLVENTTGSAETVLCKLAEKLEAVHGMKMEVLVHKSQRSPLKATQVAELKGKADFAITGVGA